MDFDNIENIDQENKKKNKKENIEQEPKKVEGKEIFRGEFLSNSTLIRKHNSYLKKSFEHYCKINRIHKNTVPEWERLFNEFV